MAMNKKVYDALILGAGPAGLSAALGLSRVKRTALVLGQSRFRNDGIKEMHTVLGHDKRHPAEFRKMGRQNIEAYGDDRIEFAEGEAVRVGKIELDQGHQGFEVEAKDQRIWKGRKLILAMGSRDILPDIQGYQENWPDNIYQCLFCDGRERSDMPIGLMGFDSPKHLSHALMVCHMSGEKPNVTIFTNGPLSSDAEIQKAAEVAKAAGCRFEERKISSLSRAPEGELGLDVHLADGDQPIRLGFLGDKPPTEVAGEQMLVDGLGIEISRDWMGSYVKRVGEPFGETNVKGVFTAGDASTQLKQVTVAVTQGVLAAVGIVQQICGERAEELTALVAKGKEGEGEKLAVENGVHA